VSAQIKRYARYGGGQHHRAGARRTPLFVDGNCERIVTAPAWCDEIHCITPLLSSSSAVALGRPQAGYTRPRGPPVVISHHASTAQKRTNGRTIEINTMTAPIAIAALP